MSNYLLRKKYLKKIFPATGSVKNKIQELFIVQNTKINVMVHLKILKKRLTKYRQEGLSKKCVTPLSNICTAQAAV